jgi:hypothetical protein
MLERPNGDDSSRRRVDVIKRLMDGWRARQFVKDRERLLHSDNPVLAFASNPSAGTQVLRPGETNDAAFALLTTAKVPLIRVHDGVEMRANQFGRLVFGVPWDPLSAAMIGSHRKSFDDGRLGSFGIVFLESSREGLAERAAKAWYRTVAFVLPDGHPLRDAVAVVPFVAMGRDGGAFEFAEGVEASSLPKDLA